MGLGGEAAKRSRLMPRRSGIDSTINTAHIKYTVAHIKYTVEMLTNAESRPSALTTSSVNSIPAVPIRDIIVALYEEFTNSLRRVIKYDIIIFNENSKNIRPINTMKRSPLKPIIKNEVAERGNVTIPMVL